MKTIIKKQKKTWIIFDDKELNKSPIQRVITNDNNEEYKLGILLLSKKIYALEECELIERVDNIGFIADSYGKFEKLWQFSSYLIQHGCKIVEVNNSDKFLDYKNLPLLTEPSDKIIIRAMEEGRTNYVPHVVNGINCKIVVMGDKQYIPDVTTQQ